MEKVNRKVIATGAIAIVLVALIAITVLARGHGSGALPPNDADPVTIARFVMTSRFERLGEAQQRGYMRRLRTNAGAIDAAFAAGTLSKDAYAAAKSNIWLERQLEHMDDYFRVPPGQARIQYLDDLVAKKIEKRKAAGASASATNSGGESYTGDNTPFMDARKSAWPQELRARWTEYRNALNQRQRARGI